MEEYKKVREDLVAFSQSATGQDYDAIYYYIGKYDFNQEDVTSIDTVVDMVLEKATAGKRNPYRNFAKKDPAQILYKNADVAHPTVGAHVVSRLEAERSSELRGMTYIPDSERFSYLITCAVSAMTSAELNKVLSDIDKSQTFWGECKTNLKRQLDNPIDNIGVEQLILSVIVVLWVICAIICGQG